MTWWMFLLVLWSGAFVGFLWGFYLASVREDYHARVVRNEAKVINLGIACTQRKLDERIDSIDRRIELLMEVVNDALWEDDSELDLESDDPFGLLEDKEWKDS